MEGGFEKYASMITAKLHRARIRDGGKPGMLDYTQTNDSRLYKKWVPAVDARLENPPSVIGLLLGTSDTTSKPKGVLIPQSSLV